MAGGDERLLRLAEAFPPAAHALLRDEDEESIWSAAGLLAVFGDAVADACGRMPGPGASAARTIRQKERAARAICFDQAWAAALTGDDPMVELPEEAVAGELARWAAPVARSGGATEARLCVQLRTPQELEPDAPWPLGLSVAGC